MNPARASSSRNVRAAAMIIAGFTLLTILILDGAAAATHKSFLPTIKAGASRYLDTATHVDVNQIDMFLSNAGSFGRDLQSPGGPAGTFYPRGTDRTCLYDAGLWIGGVTSDGNLRVAVSEYSMEFQPGTMIDGGGWGDPNLPRFHVYKLTPESGPGDPDYDEWPVADGAPLGRDGTPLRAGDQTLWSVFNDADPTHHTNNAGSTLPIGVEVAHLTYAYDLPDPLGRVILMDYRIWNRGNNFLRRTFASIWADIDLGGANDDLSGCDSLLSTAYVYNAGDDEVYGMTPPAVALALLKAPGIGGDRACSAVRYINGTDPMSAEQSYNYMQGLDEQGEMVIDPTTGRPTRFWFGGDPISGVGWVDYLPSDKRAMLTCGPFDFAPTQTESIRVALVVGQGDDRLASVKDMRDAIRSVRRLNEKGAFPRRSRWAIAGPYPDPYDPTVPAMASVFVVAPTAGHISISVENEGGEPVNQLADDIAIDAGIARFEWDGRNNFGDLVPPGAYQFALTVHEPKPSSGQVIRDTEEIRVSYPPPRGSGARFAKIIHGCGWIGVESVLGVPGVRVSLYNTEGRRVRVIEEPAGARGVFWDGRDGRGSRLPSGIYFVRSKDGVLTERVLLLR